MTSRKIPKRISTAIVNSLSAGVVPRVGLEYIAVGRKDEIEALLHDLNNVAEGGASFRFIIGRYGSGKSFMLQLLRNHAMDRGFVVADVDLSPERRLTGSNGSGLATYRELMHNLSTKTRPDGGALAAIFERWISTIQANVAKNGELHPNDAAFHTAVEHQIMDTIVDMEGMVHGFDFATVLSHYWRGHHLGDDSLKEAALRWLHGEFSTKTEARQALGVRVIIDDDDWYDYVKLMAKFVAGIGYKGLLLVIDEAVNLYKISQTISRTNNYEKLLTMFNDTMQGKAEHLGLLIGGTADFMEDTHRGLYSYEALKSRLVSSRYANDNYRDTSGPVIRLNMLNHAEIYLLLTRLRDIFDGHYQHQSAVNEDDLKLFMQEVLNRLGAEALLTPREVIRDFLSVLNILRQNPELSFHEIIQGSGFRPTQPGDDPDVEVDSPYAEFSL
ncbi:MAG: ATP-binding protein [Chloroflexota bacterium]